MEPRGAPSRYAKDNLEGSRIFKQNYKFLHYNFIFKFLLYIRRYTTSAGVYGDYGLDI